MFENNLEAIEQALETLGQYERICAVVHRGLGPIQSTLRSPLLKTGLEQLEEHLKSLAQLLPQLTAIRNEMKAARAYGEAEVERIIRETPEEAKTYLEGEGYPKLEALFSEVEHYESAASELQEAVGTVPGQIDEIANLTESPVLGELVEVWTELQDLSSITIEEDLSGIEDEDDYLDAMYEDLP